MIGNLQEDFVYNLLPDAVLSFDERGLVWAVVGGVQDRLSDMRSYGRKLSYFFDASGVLPETGNNAVLVDLQSDQGKVYTRSLDILPDTPADGTAALVTWAAQQLGMEEADLLSVRYGIDLLRLVDVDVLGYLADSIGAVLYQSTLIEDADVAASNQKLVSTYFPRLKVKGTALSFESLGKALGFDDVLMKPLWSRVSPRRPNDVGNPENDPDFAASPEFVPRQTIGPFYDPLETRDGPFFTWVGTASNGTASTQFYTTAINGFSPFITVTLLGSLAGTNVPAIADGTTVHPATGSYMLDNGEPYTKAYVEPAGSGVRFNAIVQGAAFNGLYVHVQTTGTLAVLTVTDRLSALKYRSSYFDLGLTADMDRVEEIYGAPSVKTNTDLAAGTNTPDGPAVSPFLPWVSGSIVGSLVQTDWLTSVDSTGSYLVVPRHEAAATDRQLNYSALVSAGIQVTQAFESVRPATRQPRYTATGFLIKDTVPYACYGTMGTLFTIGVPLTYSGSDATHPLGDYTVQIVLNDAGSLTTAEDASDPSYGTLWHYITSTGFSGSYDFASGSYYFNTGAVPAGVVVYAIYAIDPLSTEVIRPEPDFTVKFNGQTACLPRPEDELGDELDEVADEFPWRRDIVGGGEVVEISAYAPIVSDVGIDPVSDDVVFSDQSGADVNVYVIKSSVTPLLRFTTQDRATDDSYTPGLVGVAYSGTFKNLATLTDHERELVNSYTDFETLFEPGYAVYHAGVAQGILVADLPKFYGPHHRDNMVGWLAFNEHAEDNLAVVDHGYGAAQQLYGVTFTDRMWSDERGWYLQMRPGCSVVSASEREIEDDVTLSFWFLPGSGTGGITTIVEYGPLTFDFNEATSVVTGYVRVVGGARLPVGTWFCDRWTFLYLRKSASDASFGAGHLANPVVDMNAIAPFDSGNEVLSVRGASSRVYGIHDLRIWNSQKTAAEMDLVRYHKPTPTVVNYPVAYVYTANRQDRYGLKVLPSGWLAPDTMPAWVRKPSFGLVRRYDSMGSYSGESRFKEVGLGGGRGFPSSYVMGNVYSIIPATGTQVVAGQQGAVPGVNDYWYSDTGTGSYAFCGSTPLSNFVLDLDTTLPTIVNNASGAAYSPITDSLFVVRNSDSYIFEFTTSGAYVRTITTTGFLDMESICWMYGSYFAVVEEDTSNIVVLHITPATTALDKTADGTIIDPGLGNLDASTGGGLEGLTYDSVNDVFYVCKERRSAFPTRAGMAVYKIEWSGSYSEPFYAPYYLPSGITDLSDIFYDSYTDRIYLLSDESNAIVDVDLNGQVYQVVGYPAGMTQPEGMTFNSDRSVMWLISEPNEIRRYVKSSVAISGTATPWPNSMRETNPCREAIWVEGDDRYVWEVTLDGTLSTTEFKAVRLFKNRSDAEITLVPMYDALLSTGTYYVTTDTGWISASGSNPATITVDDSGTAVVNSVDLTKLVWSEQPTGAEVVLSENGTYLAVSTAGVVYQSVGTYPDSVPLFMYQNSGIVAYGVSGTVATSAFQQWTDRGNSADDQNVDETSMPTIVSNGTLNVAARGDVGEITFLNAGGVLNAGVYRLKVESGNIGRVDSDFTGFQVEITVNAKVLTERLLKNRSGFNIRGTDEFEFELEDNFTGDWFLTFYWTNPYSNPTTGTQRQLAIYSYELRKLETKLYQVSINPTPVTPLLTLLSTSSYTADTPGGWLVALNSYGTFSHATHESVVFSSNDTITSKHPLSDVLTGNTSEKREDILLPEVDVILPDEPDPVFGPVGTLTEPYYNEPLWMMSGGITPNPSVVIAAKLRHDSSQVRVAVSTDLTFGDAVYTELQSASLTDNNLVLKWHVPNLSSGTRYFYAVEADGSLYTSSTGTFRTWGTTAMDFNFGVAACEGNFFAGGVRDNPLWDVCRSNDLHFLLNCGDFHYGDYNADNVALYRLAYDLVLSQSRHRQAFLEIPFVYIYDDHDYSGNNMAKDAAGRDACLTAYREVVPHYQLPAGAGANPSYFSFRVGRCQFIVTDLRSMADPYTDAQSSFKTMLGETQKAWFKQQVLQANADPNIGAIFWVSSVPWTGASAYNDKWMGYRHEREELSNFLKTNSVTRFFILHGDEHSTAIDDGRYSDWATGTVGTAGTGHGWPVFGCAPFQQVTSVSAGARFIGPVPAVGGPTYSHYGHVAVRDDGTNVNVGFTAIGFNGTVVAQSGTEVRWSFNGTESPRP